MNAIPKLQKDNETFLSTYSIILLLPKFSRLIFSCWPFK